MLSETHRPDKKRQTGGVGPLPQKQQNTDGRRNSDSREGLKGQEGRTGDITSAPVRPSTTGDIVATRREPATSHVTGSTRTPDTEHSDLNTMLRDIFNNVSHTGRYNFAGARIPVPSQLNIPEWRRRLAGYRDTPLADYLQFGWPINFNRLSPLCTNDDNHPSAQRYGPDIEHYIATELRHGALCGPFAGPPVTNFHASPLMTKPKKDAAHRRVIMDLSWPKGGGAVNDGISDVTYIDGPATVTLPTAEYMVQRILELGPGAWLYKTDLARGYRQLRVDPLDWPLLGFRYRGQYFMDICPPFGLRSSAMCMQRTTEAICYMHGGAGYASRAYLDDFGGAEPTQPVARDALSALQDIMAALGVREAQHKVHHPAQQMVWLGIHYDTVAMRMSIPTAKLEEIMDILKQWEGRTRASRRDVQSLVGLLQFVASVSPPVRIYTNRMLQCLRDMPERGTDGLSLGFRQDLRFFLDLLPQYSGVRILDKQNLPYQASIELDACLTGCGATIGEEFYSEVFPPLVLEQNHSIAHLEMLNVVVALKVWRELWAGKRVRIEGDNSNTCLALQTGRSRDPFLQHCVREVFLITAAEDIELLALHKPGVLLVRADALSRAPTSRVHRKWVNNDSLLRQAHRVRVPPEFFELSPEL